VLIKDNLFEDVDGTKWGGGGRLFQVVNGTVDVGIDHNTGVQSGDVIGSAGAANTGFVYRNNITPNNRGVVGGDAPGWSDPLLTDPLAALNTYFPNAIFVNNALAGGDPSSYPFGNFFPGTLDAVGFVDEAGADYHLGSSSPYRNAGSDGRDLGADIDALGSGTAGVDDGALPDSIAPAVSITAPAAGDVVTGTIPLSADVSDSVGVTSVQFTLDGAPLGLHLTAAPWVSSWNTGSTATGPHTIRAVARDAAGNVAGAAITVTVASADSAPPVISGVSATGITGSAVTMGWVTDEASDSRVEYGATSAYGSVASSATLVTAHALTLTGLSENTLYHYRVLSRAAGGNVATSRDFTFATLPLVAVTITAPAAGAAVAGKITVSATATAAAGFGTVQFRLDGRNLGGKLRSSPYRVTWDTTHAANGVHTLTAVATDKLGRRATAAPVNVIVANPH
jgi:Big-like domain-containing protein/purple acid phosphatase-like protein